MVTWQSSVARSVPSGFAQRVGVRAMRGVLTAPGPRSHLTKSLQAPRPVTPTLIGDEH